MKKELILPFESQRLADSIMALLPKDSAVIMEKDSPCPTAEVYYTDFKPVKEVRAMLSDAFPDVDFVTVQRNYSLRAFAQSVFDHTSDRIYTVNQDCMVVPVSLRAYLLSFVSDKEITSDVDDLILKRITL